MPTVDSGEDLRKAKKLATRALGDHLRGRHRRAVVAATSVRAVRKAAAAAAETSGWCDAAPSRGALQHMAKLLGAKKKLSCESLLATASKAIHTEDPRELTKASAMVARVLVRANPTKDPAFAKLPVRLQSDVDQAYRSLGRGLERLLAERHHEDAHVGPEAEAFLKCIAKAEPGHAEKSCCGLLPSFSRCRSKLRAIDKLSLEMEKALPTLGPGLGRKAGLFAAALLAAALLVGGAAYAGYLPSVSGWAAGVAEGARGHAATAWDKLSVLPRWALGGATPAAGEAAAAPVAPREAAAAPVAPGRPLVHLANSSFSSAAWRPDIFHAGSDGDRAWHVGPPAYPARSSSSVALWTPRVLYAGPRGVTSKALPDALTQANGETPFHLWHDGIAPFASTLGRSGSSLLAWIQRSLEDVATAGPAGVAPHSRSAWVRSTVPGTAAVGVTPHNASAVWAAQPWQYPASSALWGNSTANSRRAI